MPPTPNAIAELDAILLRLNALAHAEGRAPVRVAYLAAAARVIEAMVALGAAYHPSVEPVPQPSPRPGKRRR